MFTCYKSYHQISSSVEKSGTSNKELSKRCSALLVSASSLEAFKQKSNAICHEN